MLTSRVWESPVWPEDDPLFWWAGKKDIYGNNNLPVTIADWKSLGGADAVKSLC